MFYILKKLFLLTGCSPAHPLTRSQIMSLTLRSVSQLTTDANTAIRRHRERFDKISNKMSSKSGVSYNLPENHTLSDVTAFFEAHSHISDVQQYHRKEMISAHKHLSPEACEAVALKTQLFNTAIDHIKKSCNMGIYLDAFEQKMEYRY